LVLLFLADVRDLHEVLVFKSGSRRHLLLGGLLFAIAVSELAPAGIVGPAHSEPPYY